MCIQEQEIRYSSSNVSGRFPDTFAYHWQEAAELLQKLAATYGSVVKIDITRTQNDPGFLSFIIFYDHIDAAKKFFDFLQTLNTLQQAIIIQPLAYNETP